MSKRERLIVIISSVVVIAGLIAGYKIIQTPSKAVESQINKPEETTADGIGNEEDKRAELNDRLIRIDSQGNAQVGVLLSNPIEDDEKYLVFETQFNTHSVNMDNYDFAKMVVFKTSDGLELKKEIIWQKGGGQGHHYFGHYKVPKIVDGKPVINSDTKFMELDISGVDNVDNRSFKWENNDLMLIPGSDGV